MVLPAGMIGHMFAMKFTLWGTVLAQCKDTRRYALGLPCVSEDK